MNLCLLDATGVVRVFIFSWLIEHLAFYLLFLQEFNRCVFTFLCLLVLGGIRSSEGRCTVHAMKQHRLVRVSSNTIKSKLQVLNHIAIVSQDYQVYF